MSEAVPVPPWAADSDLDVADVLAAVGMLHAEAARLRKTRSRQADDYENPPLRVGYFCDPGDGWLWSVSFMYAASGKQGRWSASVNAARDAATPCGHWAARAGEPGSGPGLHAERLQLHLRPQAQGGGPHAQGHADLQGRARCRLRGQPSR